MDAVQPAPRSTDVLLVGGGVASVRCARTLRRGGFDGSILLVGDERPLPYNRPPLSKELLREDLPDELVLAERAGWYERHGVEVLNATTVTGLDPDAHEAELWDGERVRYGQCLIATGAAPRTLPVPGGASVPTLRTLPDARRLRTAATELGPGAAATVVGGGLIGVEVASSLVALGLRPTLLVLEGRLWSGAFGDELSAWALERLAAAGVDVQLRSEVTEVRDGRAVTRDGDVDGRVVLAGIGVDPRVGLGEAAGLTVEDGIVVDDEGRTSADGVWAAGDVARAGPRRVEHWHAARESGERAGRSMLGMPIEPRRAPWTFTEAGGHLLDVVGSAVAWDEERRIPGRGERGGFAVAYVHDAGLAQVAIVDGAVPVEEARRLVEAGGTVDDLVALVG